MLKIIIDGIEIKKRTADGCGSFFKLKKMVFG